MPKKFKADEIASVIQQEIERFESQIDVELFLNTFLYGLYQFHNVVAGAALLGDYEVCVLLADDGPTNLQSFQVRPVNQGAG